MHLFVASLQRLQAQPPHPRQKGTVKEQTGVSPLSGLSRSPTWYPNKQPWTGSHGCPLKRVRLGEAHCRWKMRTIGALSGNPAACPWGVPGGTPGGSHTHPTEGGSFLGQVWSSEAPTTATCSSHGRFKKLLCPHCLGRVHGQ